MGRLQTFLPSNMMTEDITVPKVISESTTERHIRNGPDSELTIMQDRENLTDISMGHSNTTRILHKNYLTEGCQNSRSGMIRKYPMRRSYMIYRRISGIPFRSQTTDIKKKYTCLPECRKYRIITRLSEKIPGNLLIIH